MDTTGVKLTNKFIIVVPVFNQQSRIIDCVESIFDQTDRNESHADVGIVIRDDCSTDETYSEIKHWLREKYRRSEDYAEGNVIRFGSWSSVLLVRNERKHYPCGNIYTSVRDYVDNDDAIIGTVDGDDSLLHDKVLIRIMEEYQKGDPWLVWTQHQNQNGVLGCSQPLPPDNVIYSHRHYWSVSHFRTAKAWLYKQINPYSVVDFFDRESYVKMCGDAALLYPMIEMAGNEHARFINESCYVYNDSTGLNEHSPSTVGMQHQYSALIKNMPRYSKLDKKP